MSCVPPLGAATLVATLLPSGDSDTYCNEPAVGTLPDSFPSRSYQTICVGTASPARYSTVPFVLTLKAPIYRSESYTTCCATGNAAPVTLPADGLNGCAIRFRCDK